MAIENELKFVLDPKNQVSYFTNLLNLDGAKVYNLQQGYLDTSSRVRKVENSTDLKRTNFFTYKTAVNKQLVEIETEISDSDFDKLWTKVNKVIIKKRVVVPLSDHTWEIDFFQTANKPDYYLVMAEVEMSEFATAPESIPNFISSYLLHAVDKSDMRFNSISLNRPDAVAKLLQELRNVKHQSA